MTLAHTRGSHMMEPHDSGGEDYKGYKYHPELLVGHK